MSEKLEKQIYKIPLRLGKTIEAKIRAESYRTGISMNAIITYAIQQYFKDKK